MKNTLTFGSAVLVLSVLLGGSTTVFADPSVVSALCTMEADLALQRANTEFGIEEAITATRRWANELSEEVKRQAGLYALAARYSVPLNGTTDEEYAAALNLMEDVQTTGWRGLERLSEEHGSATSADAAPIEGFENVKLTTRTEFHFGADHQGQQTYSAVRYLDRPGQKSLRISVMGISGPDWANPSSDDVRVQVHGGGLQSLTEYVQSTLPQVCRPAEEVTPAVQDAPIRSTPSDRNSRPEIEVPVEVPAARETSTPAR